MLVEVRTVVDKNITVVFRVKALWLCCFIVLVDKLL